MRTLPHLEAQVVHREAGRRINLTGTRAHEAMNIPPFGRVNVTGKATTLMTCLPILALLTSALALLISVTLPPILVTLADFPIPLVVLAMSRPDAAEIGNLTSRHAKMAIP